MAIKAIITGATGMVGEAVLLDFGFAQHARYPDLLAEEKEFAAGSAPYVSPEQLQHDRSDSRSDLFCDAPWHSEESTLARQERQN